MKPPIKTHKFGTRYGDAQGWHVTVRLVLLIAGGALFFLTGLAEAKTLPHGWSAGVRNVVVNPSTLGDAAAVSHTVTRQTETIAVDESETVEMDTNSANPVSAERLLWMQRAGGIFVVMLILIGGAVFYILHYRPEMFHSNLQRIAFALLTVVLVVLARVCAFFDLTVMLVPVPLVIMVLSLVYDRRFGFEMAAFYGLLVGIARGELYPEFTVLILGGMVAALLTGEVCKRSTLVKAGFLVGLTQFAGYLGVYLLHSDELLSLKLRFWESAVMLNGLLAFGNGVLSGFLLTGLLPVVEYVFGITTDIKLLEWSDPNQPLLQRLLLEAPGTYHHSMVVGSLAADAAEAIDANPLLTRVSAYFHDIGKLRKPDYFTENIPDGQENPHDRLSPTMSRLIITAHPRDGAEMAQKEGLPKVVQDIILESHGCTLTKYFWDRAKQQNADADEADEGAFRYRLPKPQTKEAACVMMADAAESASRSLEAPSASKIKELVHGIILDRLHDGQLSESGLTVTDLDRIENTLVRGLNAVFHRRIAYPEQEDEGAEDRKPKSDNDETLKNGDQ